MIEDDEARMFDLAIRRALLGKRNKLIGEVRSAEAAEARDIADALAMGQAVGKSWEERWRVTEQLREVNRLLEAF